ncbi:Uncharacterised protein [Vibrio cholerae]|uniref:Uncharacterized protein n=1 Tax=Vibrio cholerae TaxID=666 RepID=A0A655PIH1_VIBCL|nr:hypothetical protein VS84_00449 [Vibrio cholerae]KKP21699.1 hypothetical protein VS86_00348 [Vibrio cholerae]CSA11117.1 Uncharacterised protein [Vibrio cholerae]CSA14084.1 Uncharacterised protein [Vibrio cholerae]CSB17052.1 Uncharacterised protein [Vibrio cholerae]
MVKSAPQSNIATKAPCIASEIVIDLASLLFLDLFSFMLSIKPII